MSGRSCPACDSPVSGWKEPCGQCGLVPAAIEKAASAVDVSRPEVSQEVEMLLGTLEKIESINEDVLIERLRLIGRATEVPTGPTFECPACGMTLPESATVCTRCGAEFVEEGLEQFQCPLCSTMVNSDATKCPGCGAEFAESGGDGAQEPKATDDAPEPGVPAQDEEAAQGKETKSTKEKDEKAKEKAAKEPKKDTEKDGKKKKKDDLWGGLLKKKK